MALPAVLLAPVPMVRLASPSRVLAAALTAPLAPTVSACAGIGCADGSMCAAGARADGSACTSLGYIDSSACVDGTRTNGTDCLARGDSSTCSASYLCGDGPACVGTTGSGVCTDGTACPLGPCGDGSTGAGTNSTTFNAYGWPPAGGAGSSRNDGPSYGASGLCGDGSAWLH